MLENIRFLCYGWVERLLRMEIYLECGSALQRFWRSCCVWEVETGSASHGWLELPQMFVSRQL